MLSGAPTPLGRLVTYDVVVLRFSGFRFDRALDPAPDPGFIAPSDIRLAGFLVDLRAADETGLSLSTHAQRLQTDDFSPSGPRPALVSGCSGLSFRPVGVCTAEQLSQHWQGEIKLLALGDIKGETT